MWNFKLTVFELTVRDLYIKEEYFYKKLLFLIYFCAKIIAHNIFTGKLKSFAIHASS